LNIEQALVDRAYRHQRIAGKLSGSSKSRTARAIRFAAPWSAAFLSRAGARLPQVPRGEYNRRMTRQRIMLVDDHEVVRLGLKALIDRRPDMEVVAEADSAEEAVTKALAFRPDSIVMDIRLGSGSGIDACREITAQIPSTKIIMLTSYAEDEVLFAAIRAGAAGYVLKQAGGQDVLRALEAVAQGQALLDPALTEQVFAQVRRAARDQEATAFSMLSEQERRVLALVAKGKTNHEIAQGLHLGEGTVRNYVSNILGKLDVANRAEAASYATKHNLIAPD
jgi:two-component system response regulator DevR